MTYTEIYLERLDVTHNMARYYRLSVLRTLFGEWVMRRDWGRVGKGGQSLEHVCPTADEAHRLLEVRCAERKRRGYR